MKSQNDESIEKIFVAKGRFYIYRLLLSIFLLFSIYYIYKVINNSYRILFTVILILFGINYVIQTKRALKRIRTKVKVEDILNNGKTGDIILFKSNENYDVPDFLFFKVVPTNLTNDIWTNIGILQKDEMTQQIFVWICDDKKEVDEFSSKSKTGVKKLLFLDYIKKYNGIIAYSKINIDIDNKKFMKKVKVYSKYPFIKIIFENIKY